MIEAECSWILKRLDGMRSSVILDIGGGTHYARLRAQPYVAYDLHRPLLLQNNQVVVLEPSLIQRKKDILFSIPMEGLSRVAALSPSFRRRISSVVPLAKMLFGDCQKIPRPDCSYDVIFLLSLLEHVTDPETALREAVRVLRKGGSAFVSVPEICPYHPAPIDTGLRMKPNELTSFTSPYLTVLDQASLSVEPSCRVSILHCRKES